jgi:hypothetical protein
MKGEKSVWEPMLLVRLGVGRQAATPRFRAVVDSGSPFCIFKAGVAELLGIDVEKGEQDTIGGIIAGAREPIYFHNVNIYVEADWVVPVKAGFVRKLNTTGILGRIGFFDNFHVHFDHSVFPPVVEIKRIEKVQ